MGGIHGPKSEEIIDMDRQYVEFTRYTVQCLCPNSQIEISKNVDDRGPFLVVKGVKKEDMKNLIGKEGQTIRALRRLVQVLAAFESARPALKIEEPEDGGTNGL